MRLELFVSIVAGGGRLLGGRSDPGEPSCLGGDDGRASVRAGWFGRTASITPPPRFRCPGLDQETNGTFSRVEFAPLTKVGWSHSRNRLVHSRQGNSKSQTDAFSDPFDSWLGYNPKDTVLRCIPR